MPRWLRAVRAFGAMSALVVALAPGSAYAGTPLARAMPTADVPAGADALLRERVPDRWDEVGDVDTTGCEPARSPAPSGAGAGTGQRVSVCVPAVSFQRAARSEGGRLRVAVLVSAGSPDGVVLVRGAAACSTPAAPATATWLDCPLPESRQVDVRVRLRDHRVVTATLPVIGA